MAKRRLADLYVVGKELTFDDGAGEPVTVFLRKLNPIDQETAIRKANAARSRVHATGKDKDSDEYGDLLAQAIDIGTRDDLINYLISDKLTKFTVAKEAELGAEEEWSKDGYLDGLREAWESGMQERYHTDPEDSEARHVFAELERFAAQVKPFLDDEKTNLQAMYEEKSVRQLRDLVAEELVGLTADIAWVREYRACEIWLSVRDPEAHGKRYFESREELDSLPSEVMNRLAEEYRVLTVEGVEGKGSRGTADSSLSSEQPAQEGIIPSSGPEVVRL